MKQRRGGIKAKVRRPQSPAVKRRKPASAASGGLRPIKGAQHHEMGGITIDAVAAANGQVKRVVYPPGFRWSTHMRPVISTDLCMHAHVGFLASGRVKGQYRDGCTFAFTAPAVITVEPGHDAWVVGKEAAVLIQFDAARETVQRFGLPPEHRHSR